MLQCVGSWRQSGGAEGFLASWPLVAAVVNAAPADASTS
jgi:hypothetical protein